MAQTRALRVTATIAQSLRETRSSVVTLRESRSRARGNLEATVPERSAVRQRRELNLPVSLGERPVSPRFAGTGEHPVLRNPSSERREDKSVSPRFAGTGEHPVLRGPSFERREDNHQTPGQQLIVSQGSFLGPFGSRIP